MSALHHCLSLVLVLCTFTSLLWCFITAITLPRLLIVLILIAAWVSLRSSSDKGSKALTSTPDLIRCQLTNSRRSRSRSRSHLHALQLQLPRNSGVPSSAHAAQEKELDDFGPSLASPSSTPKKRLLHVKFVPKAKPAPVRSQTTPLPKYQIGDERTDYNGERYRLDGDGVERRLCLVREMRMQHSMTSDASWTQEVIVERWIANVEDPASQVTSEEEECEKASETASRRNASGQHSDEQATPTKTGPSLIQGVGGPSHSSLHSMVSHLFPSHPNGRLRILALPPRRWTVIRAARIIEDEASVKRERDRRRQGSVRLGGEAVAPEEEGERRAAERSCLTSSTPRAWAIEKDLNLPRTSYHSEAFDTPATPSSTMTLGSFALDAPSPTTHAQPFVWSAAVTSDPPPPMQQEPIAHPSVSGEVEYGTMPNALVAFTPRALPSFSPPRSGLAAPPPPPTQTETIQDLGVWWSTPATFGAVASTPLLPKSRRKGKGKGKGKGKCSTTGASLLAQAEALA
ncbi:hypothetical protein JCM5296_003144 [Sporobolomyces johnsonii]